MEVIINAVVGKIVEVLTGQFLTSTGRQIGYVVHYKKNMEDLDAKVQNLREVMGTIKGKVDEAEQSGEDIEKDVSNWLLDVNKKEEDLNKLLVDRENVKSCVHVCSRYRVSKKGKTLLSDVSGLIDVAGKIVTVGRSAIWYTATTNFEHFKSRESVCKQIIKVLKDDINYKIGIYGMGGSGKTRMAEEIAKQAKKENLFDDVAKAVFSQSPDLTKIQEELADCLNLSFTAKSDVGRKGELYNRLKKGEKILVIIDDIWNDEIKLEEIGIPSSNNHIKGCKVLLTSRREDVCIKMGVQENFPIGLLQEYEAWDLFKKTVGDFIESPYEIHSVAKQVCRECNCLPLAIVVVGATLSNQKENHVWDDALVQLSNCRGYNIEGVTEKLYSRIEWSYKYQKQLDVKSCFLHCSLFPEDAEIPIDDLVMYGVATRFLKDNLCTIKTARDRTLVLVDTLKKSHLLLEGKNKDFVKMHDVIRDVAISIASKEGFLAKTGVPKWPEKDEYESHKVISLRSKNICELPRELECSELRTLVLECDTNHRPQALDSFFKRTENVEVLDLRHVRLPSSLLNLINLRMLRLCNCGQVNLAFLKELRNLEILGIADSDLKQVAVEVGQLTTLRWLDLRSCTKLEIIPSGVIKSLSNIEELYIPRDFGGWGDEGNAGLDELNSLTRLTTLQIHIGDGMLLPNELCFKLVNRFKISIGRTSGLKYDEENLGARILRIEYISLRMEFNILMEKAEVLILERVEGLKNVLHSGDGKWFRGLNYLKIVRCNDMEHLLGRQKWNLQTQGSFSKLSVLIVKNCTLKFLFFPSMARALQQLQELDISNCEIMEEIILDDEEVMDKVIFRQLKKMKLCSLPVLRSICSNTKKMSTTECSTSALAQALFNGKVSFPVLEKLNIYELSVTAIWDNRLFVGPKAEAESFQLLQCMEIKRCWKLVNVITAVETRGEEEVMDDEIIVFPQLKKMTLVRLPYLKSFWSSTCGSEKAAQALFNYKVSFPVLEILEIGVKSITTIWDNQLLSSSIARNLRQLQYLAVRDCEKIEEIIAVETGQEKDVITDEEIIMFPRLKKMELKELPNLKSFWSDTCGSKKAAVENDIPQVQALFNYKVSFPALEELEIYNLKSVAAIWDNRLFLDPEAEEESFQLWDNQLLSSSIARNLRQLQHLAIRKCEKIEEIIAVETGQEEDVITDEEIIMFSRLKKMELKELPNLKSFWSDTCGSKKAAVENDIPQVQALFNYKVSFPALEELDIYNLKSVTAIWDNRLFLDPEAEEESFQLLQCMKIEWCEKLVNVITAVEMGQGEKEVTDDEIIVFPQLKEIKLSRLRNLKSFCSATRGSKKAAVEDDISQVQALFNYKVKFPSLEDFCYVGVESTVKEIWNSMVPTDAVCKLRRLQVDCCHELLSVAPSKFLGSFQNLEKLKINNCPSLEEVFKVEGGSNAEEGIVARDKVTEKDLEDNLVFPQLKSLVFSSLPRLRIFYRRNCISELPSLVDMWIESCPNLEMFPCPYQNTAPLQPFSKEKVAFPILDDLTLSDGSIFEDILYGHVPAGSFSKVRKLDVRSLNKLVNVSTLLQRFEVVEELKVLWCFSLEVVFNTAERGITVSSRIKKLRLSFLPKLVNIGISMEPQRFLAFHDLTSLTVEFCDSLKYLFSLSMARNLTKIEDLRVECCDMIEEIIRNEDQGEEDGAMVDIVFPNLRSLEVKSCNRLKYLFSLSMARNLTKIKDVSVERCDAIEAIIGNEDQGEEDGAIDEIVFPALESIAFYKLTNLTSFCGTNNAFKLPSLQRVFLHRSPKIQTFTSGPISTPILRINGVPHKVSDLNNYIQQGVEEGKGSWMDYEDSSADEF